MKFSQKVKKLKPSSVFVLLQKIQNLKKQGIDVVNLSVGEPEWSTYPNIKEAAKKAIDENYTKYTPSAGRKELRERISQQASKQLNVSFSPEEVLVSAGCKFNLFTLFQCLCDLGDEVIFPAPYWMSYIDVIELSGASCSIVPTDETTNFKITPDQLRAAITKKTRIFLLNSPSNPTGAVYSEKELLALAEVLKEFKDIIIITDDIYDRMVFKGFSSPHILSVCPELKNRTFCANGASKNFLMTGWRLGWVLGPKEAIKVLSAFCSQSVSCANSVAQKAIEDTLISSEDHVVKTAQELSSLKDFILEKFSEIPGIKPYPPEGTFYLWVNVKDLLNRSYEGIPISSSLVLAEQLLDKVALACLNGEKFGSPGYLRFSYAAQKDQLEKAVSRLSQFVSKLT